MTETNKKPRTYKPEAEVFTNFDECFIAWADNSAGRRVYKAKSELGDDVYILAGTKLQAIKKWVVEFDDPVIVIDRDELHRMLAERNVMLHAEHGAA